MSTDRVTVILDGATIEVSGPVAAWLRQLHDANAEKRDALLKQLRLVQARPASQQRTAKSISYRDFVEQGTRSPERLEKLLLAGTSVRVTSGELRALASRISSADLTGGKAQRLREVFATLDAEGTVSVSKDFAESLAIRYEPDESPTPSPMALPAGAAVAVAVITVFAAGFGIGMAVSSAYFGEGDSGESSVEITATVEGDGNITISTGK